MACISFRLPDTDRVPKRRCARSARSSATRWQRDGAFARLYAAEGRPSIAPQKLMRASILQAIYSMRQERQLMEYLGDNLLHRWFVGLGVHAPM